MNELVEIKGTPEIPDSWDYDSSVAITKPNLYKLKNLTIDIINELYIAREQ